MLSINSQFVIYGCPVTLSWNISREKKRLFLWTPVSFLFWKNYTPIAAEGQMEVIANTRMLRAKTKELTLFGFKTIESLSVPVNSLELKNIHTKIHFFNTEIKTKKSNVSFSNPTFELDKNFIPPSGPNFINVTKVKFPIINNLNDFTEFKNNPESYASN
jgi:hypothetical protein